MALPLASIVLHHSTLELWPDSVRTVFHSDGASVPAAPSEGEDLIDTAVHEALHAILAQAWGDQPSDCLRSVADGDGQRWTDSRRAEESLVFGMGPLVKRLHEALASAYRDGRVARDAAIGAQRSDALRLAAMRRTLRDLQHEALPPAVAEVIAAALHWDAEASRGVFRWKDEGEGDG